MPDLTLRFKKKRDAAAVLTCVRPDGTWTADEIGPGDGFGPLHDLAHYVVESHLGLTQGFLGLLSAGWGVRDFERPGTAARLPREAMLAESLAGFLSLEAAAGTPFALADLDAGEALDQEELDRMRERLEALHRRWRALPAGETLVLEFPAPAEAPAARRERLAS